MSRSRHFFDHNSTTPVLPQLGEHLSSWIKDFGNPSSIHREGQTLKGHLRRSKQSIARYLGVSPEALVFTSGGSESNNVAIKSSYFRLSQQKNFKNHFVTSSVEHPSVLKVFDFLSKQFNLKVTYLPVSREGVLDFNFLLNLLEETSIDFLSCMMVNNETGVVFPVEKIAQLAKEHNFIFHSDGVQALGKLSVQPKDLGVDLMSFSAHKCNALKGCGVLYIKSQCPFEPLIHGGKQERGRRAGTENVLGARSFAFSLEQGDHLKKAQEIELIRDQFEARVEKEISGLRVTGKGAKRVGNTSHLMIDGVDGESLLMSLDLAGFSVSTGAACSSGSQQPSPVLLAMGYSLKEAQGSLRLSFGLGTTGEALSEFLVELKSVIERLRRVRKENEGG